MVSIEGFDLAEGSYPQRANRGWTEEQCREHLLKIWQPELYGDDERRHLLAKLIDRTVLDWRAVLNGNVAWPSYRSSQQYGEHNCPEFIAAGFTDRRQELEDWFGSESARWVCDTLGLPYARLLKYRDAAVPLTAEQKQERHRRWHKSFRYKLRRTCYECGRVITDRSVSGLCGRCGPRFYGGCKGKMSARQREEKQYGDPL